MKKKFGSNRERAQWIYYQMRLKHVSLQALARQLGISVRHVYHVASGRSSSAAVRYVQEAIAQAIGAEYEALWGGPKGRKAA